MAESDHMKHLNHLCKSKRAVGLRSTPVVPHILSFACLTLHHCRWQIVVYSIDSWVARCDIKGSDSTMLNPIFWKKVQGQKHPGRWGIVEHQIPSIKGLFKTNSKSHKHPGMKLLSSESKTQLVNQRKQKVAFNPGTAHSPEIQSYRMW